MANLSADQVRDKAELQGELDGLKESMEKEVNDGLTHTATDTSYKIDDVEAKISDIDRFPQDL